MRQYSLILAVSVGVGWQGQSQLRCGEQSLSPTKTETASGAVSTLSPKR